MNQKLPYYAAYPMPPAYDDERAERIDFEYMKSLYPEIPKKVLPYVEEECDRMEYGNSVVYDEYPDRLQLRLMCRRICDSIRQKEKFWLEDLAEVSEENTDNMCPLKCPVDTSKQPNGSRWLCDLVEIMLYQELYRRRSEKRRRRRVFY